jgi:hypothetical protein
MKAMSKVWTVLLMLAAVALVWVDPAGAQETVTASEAVLFPAWTVWAVVAAFSAVLLFAGWVEQTKNQQVRSVMNTLDEAIRGLTASTPAGIKTPGQHLIEGGVDSGFEWVARNVTQRTPAAYDDQLLAEIERRLDNKLRALGLMAGPADYDADPDAVAGFGDEDTARINAAAFGQVGTGVRGDDSPLAGPTAGQ